MRTPNEFLKNLNNKIITKEMLDMALYSVNKRAKNWRDKKREYKNLIYFDRYNNFEKAQDNELKMYYKKEKLLSILKPDCIHKEFAGYSRKRIYDYEDNYKEKMIAHAFANEIVWCNSYYDQDIETEVWFYDYVNMDMPLFRYYLFYDLDKHSYHTPINEIDVNKLKDKYNIDVNEIGELNTFGHEIDDLISVQFVDKLINLIDSGNYILNYKESNKINQIDINDCNRKYNYININRFWPMIYDYIENDINKLIKSFISEINLDENEKKEIEKWEKDKIAIKVKQNIKRRKKRKHENIIKASHKHDNVLVFINFDDELKNYIYMLAGDNHVSSQHCIDAIYKVKKEELKNFALRKSKIIAKNKYIDDNFVKWKEEVEKDILAEI